MNASEEGDRDAARSRIDEQIHTYAFNPHEDEELCALKEERNRLAPISILPQEILCIIFKHVNTPTRGQRNIKWKEFILIAHICRSWRSIAFECPSLWSRILFDSPHVAEEMLLRSKASRLIIDHEERYCNLLRRLSPSLLAQILDMGRIQELHLYFETLSIDNVVDPAPAPAPGAIATHLRSLSITHYCPPYPTLITPAENLLIPMPRLRHLNLKGCQIPWDSMHHCISPALISLKLSTITQPPRQLFFSLLSRCTNLELLDLSSFSAFPQPSADIFTPVALPKLSCCKLSLTFTQCFDFQTHVVYPVDSATISIFILDDGVPTQMTSLAALIFSCTSSNNPRRSHMSFKTSLPANVSFRSASDDEPEPAPVNIGWELFTRLIGAQPGLDLFWIPELSIQRITVNAVRRSANEWFRFFKKRNEITQLCIITSSMSPALSALSTSLDDEAVLEDDDTPVSRSPAFRSLLPHLITLTLVRPTSPFLHGRAQVDEKVRSTELYKIREYLIMRRECGCPIQNLELDDFEGIIDDEQVRVLGAEVEKITWDRSRWHGRNLRKLNDNSE